MARAEHARLVIPRTVESGGLDNNGNMGIIAASPPRSAIFDLVLIVHILVALLSVITMAAAYAAASSLSSLGSDGSWPSSAVRFFRPGPEVIGRVIHLLPVTGLALLGLSRGAFQLTDGFVMAGLALWLIGGGIAELVVFPASRDIASAIGAQDPAESAIVRGLAGKLRWGVDAVILSLGIAAIVMLAQP